jgi:hypothetical protein
MPHLSSAPACRGCLPSNPGQHVASWRQSSERSRSPAACAVGWTMRESFGTHMPCLASADGCSWEAALLPAIILQEKTCSLDTCSQQRSVAAAFLLQPSSSAHLGTSCTMSEQAQDCLCLSCRHHSQAQSGLKICSAKRSVDFC